MGIETVVTSVRPRRLLGASMVALVGLPIVASCAGAQQALGQAGASGLAGCPDVSKIESILAFDFQHQFRISADAAAKLKGGAVAAVQLRGLAAQVDADLKTTCGGIATDLGAGSEFKDGKAACDAAIRGIGAAKAKLGTNARIALAVREPRCEADVKVMADCAGRCDAHVDPGHAKVDCEPGKLSGTCEAQCKGTCDVSAAAKCEGKCKGSCDAEVKGTCSGKCNGKCDGKSSSGASCAGTCEGRCEGGTVEGQCNGNCQGRCELAASAKCDGTCTGSCSAEMKAPKCTGDVKPPQMSAECKASCDADFATKLECTPAQVGLVVTGATDAAAAERLRVTIEKNLPLVLKVAIGMGKRGPEIAANGRAVVEGVSASVDEIARTSGDTAQAGLIAGQITACLGDTFRGALDAAGSLKANVSVSVDVRASASGSASGSAGAR